MISHHSNMPIDAVTHPKSSKDEATPKPPMEGVDTAAESPRAAYVRLIAYPKLMVCWPIVIFPLLVLGAQFLVPNLSALVTPETLGAIYLLGAVLIIVALGCDFTRVESVLFVFLLATLPVVFSLAISEDLRPGFFALISPNIRYPTDFALHMALYLGLVLLAAWCWSFLFHHWVIDEKKGLRSRFFTSSKANAPLDQVLEVQYEVPDLLEYLLFTSGQVTLSCSERTVVLHHIPRSRSRVKQIRKLLSEATKEGP